MEQQWDTREQEFHDTVREYLIALIFFGILYAASYAIINYFKKQPHKDDYYIENEEDAMVYRIALWISTFTLAVSMGAVLLLPISILSNEILLWYPNSYLLQWLNGSLIHGLWNQIFLFSNLSLFVLMPFAYFLTESEGFAGSKKGIKARVYETFVVLLMLALLVFGLVWVLSAFLDNDQSSREALVKAGTSYLPYLYSYMSLLGVLLLLISTPLGFTRMFSVIGKLVVKPQFMENIEEDFHSARFEEEDLKRKLEDKNKKKENGTPPRVHLRNGHTSTPPNTHLNGGSELRQRLAEVQRERQVLDRRRKASSWQRNVGYPLLWILMFLLTVLCLFIVGWNVLRMLFGVGYLPVSIKEEGLGKVSLSMLGWFGALIETMLILYFMLASVVGLYGVPFVGRMIPHWQDTSMTKVIVNCLVLLILSSALPVLSRILGVTNYDLMGEFGQLDWLENFYLIFGYNILFGALTSSCLLNKFTSMVRQKIMERVTDQLDKVRKQSHISRPLSWHRERVNGPS
ncbi:protein LMBR1L-like [Amphiura filiformis]|uniref:protein LMBR1L-like n=1 Tax=Amphiura filiformis TaxID=82378 RepID=UPI003B2124F2